MGLLAPNAIYEDGSIIYQNQDIMQLPEEDFTKLEELKYQ